MINERRKDFFTESKHEALLFLAERNPRKRAREVMGVSQEGACIILNVVLPDSYIRPHKYENSQTPNTLKALEGVFKLFIFDDEGVVIDTALVSRKKVVKIPADTWHTVVALTPCAFSEAKREFGKKEIFAPWAPEEGTPEGKIYLEKLRKVVDKKESQG
jgi:cupin fold WbuC family metalloprotein